MDALLPLASALIGALAALSGHAVTHLFGLNKERHVKAIERADSICEAIYSIRRRASLRAMKAAEGIDVLEYSEELDRLHWHVALFTPKIVVELNEYLLTIRVMDTYSRELIHMRKGQGGSRERALELEARAGELSQRSHDMAAKVVTAMRKKYQKVLLLP